MVVTIWWNVIEYWPDGWKTVDVMKIKTCSSKREGFLYNFSEIMFVNEANQKTRDTSATE